MDFQHAGQPRATWLYQGLSADKPKAVCVHLTFFSRCEASDWWALCLACFASLKRFPSLGNSDLYEYSSVGWHSFAQGFGDPIHKTRFWGLLGKQGLRKHQVLRLKWIFGLQTTIFSGFKSREFHSASSTPTWLPTPSSTRLGLRATTRSWGSTSSPRPVGLR